jgi:predicted amidohydrolase YtcJ
MRDYNRVGITGVIDRSASSGEVQQYRRLHDAGQLSVRFAVSHHVDTAGRTGAIQEEIRRIAADPLCQGDPMLRIIGIKTFLDGGMLTGSAFMRQPWGVSEIYGIADPDYRGLRYIPADKLVDIVRTAAENDLQFTAHSVGDGAVHALLDAYDEVNKSVPIASSRPCITHSNFMSREAIDKAAGLGVSVDIQPAWLYLDTRTLVAQFGYERLRYFQPLKSLFESHVIAGGGSDHMQKIGSLRSINPYDPFLGMWVTLTRRARWYDGALHPQEALSRQQAIRFYTWNNAFLMRLENQTGSLEEGKLADFILVDRDLLRCTLDEFRDTRVLATYLGGQRVSGVVRSP